MTKAPRHVLDTVFIYPNAKALNMLPIIMFTCAYGLKSVCRVRARDSALVVRRVRDLQVQVAIYLSTGERKKVRRHSLKGEKVFTADLGIISQ